LVIRLVLFLYIQDNTSQAFEEVLPYDKFSMRLPSEDIPRLEAILRGVSEDRRAAMRRELACVWPRLVWSSVVSKLPSSLFGAFWCFFEL
jgi:hypothetical protein